jgi:hypothetical protein
MPEPVLARITPDASPDAAVEIIMRGGGVIVEGLFDDATIEGLKNDRELMDQISFPRLRGNLKALSAALGVVVLITMGAVTLAYPTSAVGTRSDSWKASTAVTLIPATRTQPSARPQYIVDPCYWATAHQQLHNNC